MSGPFNEEVKLLERCVRQDKSAWELFVKKYNLIISHSIVQTLRSYSFPIENEVVEDLFNTVFLSLIERNCRKLRKFKWKCRLSSWLHLIAVRTTIDFLRKQKKHVSLNGEKDGEIPLKDRLVNGNPLPDEAIEEEEKKAIFEQMKKRLTGREQFFIELYYNRGLSPSEISKIMKINENNLYQLKSLVRRKMKNILEKIQ